MQICVNKCHPLKYFFLMTNICVIVTRRLSYELLYYDKLVTFTAGFNTHSAHLDIWTSLVANLRLEKKVYISINSEI